MSDRIGFPWDRLAEAVEQRQEAERLALFALESGTDATRKVAATNLALALQAEQNCRMDSAGAFLFMMQHAIDERFTEFWAKVMAFAVKAEWRKEVERFFSTKPGGTTWAVQQEQRAEEQAEEIAALKQAVAKLQRETWALANALAALEQKQTDTGTVTDAADPRSRERDPERQVGSQARGSEPELDHRKAC